MSARTTHTDIRRKHRLRQTAYRRALEQAYKAEQAEKAKNEAQPQPTK